MSLSDLKTITMRFESTANFVIKMFLHEGVGYEVVWWRRPNDDHTVVWDRKHHMSRDLAAAEQFYDEQLRRICVAEAKLALGLFEPFMLEKEK
jgi:hypothetical protein